MLGVMSLKEKKQRLSTAARLSNATQIPIDMAAGCPYVKMCFNREIIVEDAGNLIQYNDENVKVKQRKNTVSVCGRGLKLSFLSNGDLRVTGFVKSVSFE